jgi:hypothetical protein
MTFGSSLPGFLLKKSRALAKLFGPALQVEKSEAGGGLICWGRKKIRLPAPGDCSFSAASCACRQHLENNAFRPGGPEIISANACWRGF